MRLVIVCVLAVLLGFCATSASALPPRGFAGCSSNSYVRDTMFEGGPYRVDEFFWCATLNPVRKIFISHQFAC